MFGQTVAGVGAAAQRLATHLRSLNGFQLEFSGEWPEGLDAGAVDHYLARFLAQAGVEPSTRDELVERSLYPHWRKEISRTCIGPPRRPITDG